MFTNIFDQPPKQKKPEPKEGDLYKVITAHGKTFEIYYGYYEETDRLSPYGKPMEMYPNFIENPVYTDKGIPFVTAMQKPCKHFKGEPDVDNTCYQCSHYERCEELLGVCRCAKNRKPQNGKGGIQNE